MKDKDKLWIEYRINIGNIDIGDVPMYMEEVSKNLKGDDSVKSLFITVRDEESTVRLIYDPKGKHNKHQLNTAKKYMTLKIKELEEKYGI